MNPIHPPQSVCRKMERRRFGPVFIDVVAHLFDILWDNVCAWRCVLASLNLYPSWTKYACERTDPCQGAAGKGQDYGKPEFRRALRVRPIVYQFKAFIELARAGCGVMASSLFDVVK